MYTSSKTRKIKNVEKKNYAYDLIKIVILTPIQFYDLFFHKIIRLVYYSCVLY